MFSVIIPTHNRHSLLSEALQSLTKQSLSPNEVVIVDDHSVPAVREPDVRALLGAIPLTLIRTDSAHGAACARNIGVLAATSEWIAFLDDDDTFCDTKLSALASLIKASNEQADLIFHPAMIEFVNERITYVSTPRSYNSPEEYFRALLLRNVVGGTSMVALRRKVFVDAGMFDSDLLALEDYELWLRLAKLGYTFKYHHEPLTQYRHRTKSTQLTSSSAASLRTLEIIEEKYRDDYVQLTARERKVLQARQKDLVFMKACLTGDRHGMVRACLSEFPKGFSARYLAQAILSIFGVGVVVRGRAILSLLRRVRPHRVR